MVSRVNAVSVLIILICLLVLTGLSTWILVGEEQRGTYVVNGANSLAELDKNVCSSPDHTDLRVSVNESVENDTMSYSFTVPNSVSGLHIYVLFNSNGVLRTQNFSNSTYGYYLRNDARAGELVIDEPLGVMGNNSWSISSPTVMRMVWVENGQVMCSSVLRENSPEPLTTSSDGRVLTTTNEWGFVLLSKEQPNTYSKTLEDGSEVQLIVHSNESIREGDVFAQLNQANHAYSVTCNQDLALFVIPGSQYEGNTGRALIHPIEIQKSFWVASEVKVEDNHRSTLIHEYIHTTQCFRTKDDMEWIFEASATYYGGLISSETEYNGSTMPGFSRGPYNGTLTDTNDFNHSYRLDYSRGARALLHLDYEIQTHSSKSLEDVMLWMNQQNHGISYDEFREKIVSLTDEETGKWMDAHIAGDEPLPVYRAEWYFVLDFKEPETHRPPPSQTHPETPTESPRHQTDNGHNSTRYLPERCLRAV